MATFIHHGPPGSFKSFTLVQRFAIPALKAGRVVVTNIRGFDSMDRIQAVFNDIDFPDTADLIWIDTRTQTGRDCIACFWHWIPFGALVIIDEIQEIYPNRADFKLTSLDQWNPPEGFTIPVQQLSEPRPRDFFVAIDKQRHFNWDILSSTTNIAKVKKEVRQAAEWAYRHRNISGFLPWYKNTWKEFQHDPESNGKAVTQYTSTPIRYIADERIFRCYSSTATGNHQKPPASRSLLSDPKILLVGIIMVIATFVFIYSQVRYQDNKTVMRDNVKNDIQNTVKNNSPADNFAVNSRVVQSPAKINTSIDAVMKLTVDNVRLWSLMGVTPEDSLKLPSTCIRHSTRITCKVVYNLNSISLVQHASDRVCYLREFCNLYFFIVDQQAVSSTPPKLTNIQEML